MSLREEIKILSGNKRRFFLLRVANMETKTGLDIVGVKQGTYNSWCQDANFVALYRRLSEFTQEYKQEAIQLLRRDNQLDAVLLESKIIAKMKAEIDTGIYELVRTNLAREVYSKLIADLDYQPKELALTWEQRIANLFTGAVPQLESTGVVEGTFSEVEGEEANNDVREEAARN